MVAQILCQRCSLPVTSLLADAQKCKKGQNNGKYRQRKVQGRESADGCM